MIAGRWNGAPAQGVDHTDGLRMIPPGDQPGPSNDDDEEDEDYDGEDEEEENDDDDWVTADEEEAVELAAGRGAAGGWGRQTGG